MFQWLFAEKILSPSALSAVPQSCTDWLVAGAPPSEGTAVASTVLLEATEDAGATLARRCGRGRGNGFTCTDSLVAGAPPSEGTAVASTVLLEATEDSGATLALRCGRGRGNGFTGMWLCRKARRVASVGTALVSSKGEDIGTRALAAHRASCSTSSAGISSDTVESVLLMAGLVGLHAMLKRVALTFCIYVRMKELRQWWFQRHFPICNCNSMKCWIYNNIFAML